MFRSILTSFSTEEGGVTLLFGLMASGQIHLRRIDAYKKLREILESWTKAA